MAKKKSVRLARSPKDCIAHDFMKRTLKCAKKFSRHEYEDLAQAAFVDTLQYAPHMMLIKWSGLHTRMVQQSFIRALRSSCNNFKRMARDQLYFDFMQTPSESFEIQSRVCALLDAFDTILNMLTDEEHLERQIVRLIRYGVEDFYTWHGCGAVRQCHVAKYMNVSNYKLRRAVKSLRDKLRTVQSGIL